MKPAKRLLAGLLLVSLFSLPAAATTVIERTLDELVSLADFAFHGTVTAVSTSLHDGEPWTDVTFEVHELLLDNEEEPLAGETLTLQFLGGSAEGRELSVALMPSFGQGDEVLLLAYAGRLYSPVVGFNQGLWRLDPAGNWLDQAGASLGLDDSGNLVRSSTEPVPAEDVTAALKSGLERR